ncbi:alpha/beta hydrolase [Carnobacterium sp.]|uniref:alpha/beta hydrolase n=1 Tax=Carnobacterium sp. TaxID=48221 RepID=UPI0028AEF816|nr:alpha/beta hydrolase [Carnobacterium sp.]
MKPEIYSFSTQRSLTLSASFYRSSAKLKNHTIIYLHGGGLIWGDRDDLPQEYIELFLKAGYHFLAIDYPLAPETALPEIYASTVKAVEWFSTHFDTVLKLPSADYSLFGRSAGAYLSLLLGNDSTLPQRPKKIISFYGYYSIQQPFYLSPNKHYQAYPDIPKSLMEQLIQPAPLAKGLLENRYAIYIYCRQKGKWLDLVLPNNVDPAQFSLTDKELAELPPTFIAQSKTDQDVPFQTAIHLDETIRSTEFVAIEQAKHDFDSDSSSEAAMETYKKVIDWLND